MYYITLVDDYSRFTYTYLLINNDKAVCKAEVGNQLDRKLKDLGLIGVWVWFKHTTQILWETWINPWNNCPYTSEKI